MLEGNQPEPGKPAQNSSSSRDGGVSVSTITKPLVEPVADDPLQSDYDKMWETFEAAVSKARSDVAAALDKQLAKATDAGDLDQVEKWEAAKRQFVADGTLAWDTSPKAGIEWKRQYPSVPFPREFNDSVRAAVNASDSAVEALEEGYASLVKSYTKAKNIARAKSIKQESAELFTRDAENKASGIAPSNVKPPQIGSAPPENGQPATPQGQLPRQESTPNRGPFVVGPPGVGRVVTGTPAMVPRVLSGTAATQGMGKPKTPWHAAQQDATRIGGHRYKVFTDRCTWDEARKKCEEYGGHLVVVDTDAEQQLLSHWLAGAKTGILWMGATDAGSEGKWQWVTGAELSYAYWFGNQPDNFGGIEHYAEMHVESGCRWNDYTGTATRGFICEWED